MTGTVGIIYQKISFQRNPLKQSKKKNKKIASRENLITKKMSTGSSLYYDEFGSYDFAKNVLFMKHFYVFIKQTELFTSRERKCPGIFISESKDLVNT